MMHQGHEVQYSHKTHRPTRRLDWAWVRFRDWVCQLAERRGDGQLIQRWFSTIKTIKVIPSYHIRHHIPRLLISTLKELWEVGDPLYHHRHFGPPLTMETLGLQMALALVVLVRWLMACLAQFPIECTVLVATGKVRIRGTT